jgi:predicted 2-oxoglutarate/Fe(II)-dependent dioxygenase YbiX
MRPRDFTHLGLFVKEAFLDDALLRRIRRAMADDQGDPAEVLDVSRDGLTLSTEVRRAWEIALPDVLEQAVLERLEPLRREMERWCRRPLEPCDGLAALRYPTGAFYRTHRDASGHAGPLDLHRRAVSVVVFVNSGGGHASAEFSGGSLRLHELVDGEEGGLDVWPEAGTLVAFPSWLLHEVTMVERGERYSLVAWLMAAEQPPPTRLVPTE